MSNTVDVFVSYAREDNDFAAAVCYHLQQKNLNVWRDTRVANGQYFREEIREKLDEAQAVLVCWTQNAIESRFVLDEADQAVTGGKLLMLREEKLTPEEIPLGFRQIQCHTIDEIEHVISAVRRLVGKPRPAASLKIFSQTGGQRVERFVLANVFSTGKPTVTFVDRSDTDEFKQLKLEVSQNGRVVVLHGPSKSGKTTLVLDLLRDKNPIQIHANDFDTVEDFYHREIARNVGLPSNVSAGELSQACGLARRPIMVDDFHSINKKVQTAIFKRIKGFLDREVTFVLLTIPERIKSLEDAHEQISGRSAVVPAPRWQLDQIEEIGTKGFSALNLHMDSQTLKLLARNSYRNPLLMQEHCGKLCARLNVFETLDVIREVSLSQQEVIFTFQESAAKMRKMYEGIARRRGDTEIQLKGGQRATIFELILLGISQLGIVQPIGMPNLARNMRQYVAVHSSVPSKERLRIAVEELVARTKGLTNSGETIDLIDDQLVILHPYFKIFLRWDMLPRMGGIAMSTA